MIYQKNLKLGAVIAWIISIVQKISAAIATCLEEFDFLVPIRVYSMTNSSLIIAH